MRLETTATTPFDTRLCARVAPMKGLAGCVPPCLHDRLGFGSLSVPDARNIFFYVVEGNWNAIACVKARTLRNGSHIWPKYFGGTRLPTGAEELATKACLARHAPYRWNTDNVVFSVFLVVCMGDGGWCSGLLSTKTKTAPHESTPSQGQSEKQTSAVGGGGLLDEIESKASYFSCLIINGCSMLPPFLPGDRK